MTYERLGSNVLLYRRKKSSVSFCQADLLVCCLGSRFRSYEMSVQWCTRARLCCWQKSHGILAITLIHIIWGWPKPARESWSEEAFQGFPVLPIHSRESTSGALWMMTRNSLTVFTLLTFTLHRLLYYFYWKDLYWTDSETPEWEEMHHLSGWHREGLLTREPGWLGGSSVQYRQHCSSRSWLYR